MKLKHGETDEELSKNPAHAHLAEPLHIIVDYEGPASSKDQALSRGVPNRGYTASIKSASHFLPKCAAKSMLKILLHPPASEEDDVVKKQQVVRSYFNQAALGLTLVLPQLRELALMNGTFKEHPSERATRMHAGGRGAAAHTGHDWPSTSSSAYADPAVVAYNRVFLHENIVRTYPARPEKNWCSLCLTGLHGQGYAMQQAAMSGASGGWGQSPYSAYEQQYTAGYPAYPPSGSY